MASQAEINCIKYKDLILNGTMVSCDPSSGGVGSSAKSNPAFTLWEAGEAKDTWTEEIVGSWKPYERLAALSRAVSEVECGVLVIEDVGVIQFPPKKGRPGFNKVNKSLIWSVGAIVGGIAPDQLIEVKPQTWQRFIDKKTYIKSDINDSIGIGWAAIQMAKETKDKLPMEMLYGSD